MVTWDSVLVAATRRELEGRLAGARLRAFLLDRGDRSLALWFREATLVARLHPTRGALTLHAPAEPPPGARPLQARLREVVAPPDDRILRLAFLRVRGRNPLVDVVLELMTNQWNALVTEGTGRTIRHLLREREGARPLAVGGAWAPPPPSAREGRDGRLTLERWRALLTPLEPSRRRGALLGRVAWTSPLNAPALLGAAAREAEGAAAEAALAAGHRLWSSLAAAALDGSPEGAVLLPAGPDERQPYPLPLPGMDGEPAADILSAMEAAAGAGGAEPEAALLPSAVLHALERRRDDARGRLERLERELAAAPPPEELRGVGDLLLARLGEVPRGRERVTLQGFGGEAVEVTLDPALPPHENAERYYEEAARAERARERLPGLIGDARRDAEATAALLERARRGDAAPEEIEAALPGEGGGAGSGGEAEPLPYRRYRSSGGLEIRVGRGARSNDDLTFHHAAPDDVWLHARHAAGAHVILRWRGEGGPPPRDLAEAAVLAALHSKARTSGSVPVDWTRRKYVRKPRKAAPGAVVPERVSTLFVEPDPGLEARLRDG